MRRLLIERATRKQEPAESAREAEGGSRRYRPAHLLEPGLGVVPFTGRAAELEVLQAWCLDGRAGLARLVTGGGGAGKTRLALELCRQMASQRWRRDWVEEGAERDVVRLERAAAPRARLLLVADYAEGRLGLEELLKAAARDAGWVRVLLLARHAGDWWQRLGAGSGTVRDLVADASLGLMPLTGDLSPGVTANEAVRQAVPFFAAQLGVPPPDAGLITVSAGDDPRVLDLHAVALVAVLESRKRRAEHGCMCRPGWCCRRCSIMRSITGAAGRRARHCWAGRAA